MTSDTGPDAVPPDDRHGPDALRAAREDAGKFLARRIQQETTSRYGRPLTLTVVLTTVVLTVIALAAGALPSAAAITVVGLDAFVAVAVYRIAIRLRIRRASTELGFVLEALIELLGHGGAADRTIAQLPALALAAWQGHARARLAGQLIAPATGGGPSDCSQGHTAGCRHRPAV